MYSREYLTMFRWLLCMGKVNNRSLLCTEAFCAYAGSFWHNSEYPTLRKLTLGLLGMR